MWGHVYRQDEETLITWLILYCVYIVYMFIDVGDANMVK